VLIDLPRDVVTTKAEFHLAGEGGYPELQTVGLRQQASDHAGGRGHREGQEARRVHRRGVISSNAAEQIREFAELTQMPVTHTLMGHRRFPGTHPLSLGMLAMTERTMPIWRSQLGPHCRHRRAFDRPVTAREGFAPEAKIIHINVDPTSHPEERSR